MKKYFIVIISICFVFLTSCNTPEIRINTSIKELTTITTRVGKDNDMTFNYQGYIDIVTNISRQEAEKISKVIIKNIVFSENKNGTAVLYRYNKPFDYKAINAIYDEVNTGNVYDTYEYNQDQFRNYGFEIISDNEFITKLQYLVMQVDPKMEKEEIKRNIKFEIIYEFENGKKVAKPIEIEVPKI